MTFIIISLIILFIMVISFCFTGIAESVIHESENIDDWYKEQLRQARQNPDYELPDLKKIDKKE